MKTNDRLLLTELRDDILIVTLNRPAKGNALSRELIFELEDLATSLRTEYEEERPARAVVLTGSGDRAFSAGADINSLVGLTSRQARRQMILGQEAFAALENAPQPIIAAIKGVAFGGGLELAMACDMRIAAPDARFGQPEITLANLPGWGGTQRLPRLIGEGRALEMILTGDSISAEKALEFGLINQIADDPVEAAIALARRITRHSSAAVDSAKRAVYFGLRKGIARGLRYEAELVGFRCESPDQRAAVQNFLNRKSTTPPTEGKQ